MLIQKETHRVVQRVATAERVASAEFQAWLRHENASRFEVYVSMNAFKDGAAHAPRKTLPKSATSISILMTTARPRSRLCSNGTMSHSPTTW